MAYLYHLIFFQPIFNLLIFLYNIIPGHDLGAAIILLTILIRLAMYPLSRKAIEGQKALQEMQPKIEELKKKHANNKEEMGKAMMDLYKENKVNPFSSCLPLLVQLPFLIAVFQVFKNGLNNTQLDNVYSFISRPETINSLTLGGFLDLSKPNIILAVLAGAAQWWQAKMLIQKKAAVKTEGSKDEDMMAMMNKQMMYVMPVMTIFIGVTLPGGLTLYWLVTTLFTIVQQYIIMKKKKNGGNKVVEGEIVK